MVRFLNLLILISLAATFSACRDSSVEPIKVSQLQRAVEGAKSESTVFDSYTLRLPEGWRKAPAAGDSFVLGWSPKPGAPGQEYVLWHFEKDSEFKLELQLKMRYLSLIGLSERRQRLPGKQFEKYLPHFAELRSEEFLANGRKWVETIYAVPEREQWLWINIYTEVDNKLLVFSLIDHVAKLEDLGQYRELAKLILVPGSSL